MKFLAYLVYAAIFSLLYNFFLLISVTLNLDWAHSRAAGGQFDSFPIYLRVVYFFMSVLTMTLLFWLWDNRSGLVSQRSRKVGRLLGFLFSVSTLLQLISQSPNERWNAIPALVLAITFFRLVKN